MTSSSLACSAWVSRAASPVIGTGGIEAQHVAALRFVPQREAGDDRGAAVRGEFGEAGAGAGGHAEEIDEDAGIERRRSDRSGCRRPGWRPAPSEWRARNPSCRWARLPVRARRRSTSAVDQRIVERPHDHVHGRGHAGRGRRRSTPSCPGARWRTARRGRARRASSKCSPPSRRIQRRQIVAADGAETWRK